MKHQNASEETWLLVPVLAKAMHLGKFVKHGSGFNARCFFSASSESCWERKFAVWGIYSESAILFKQDCLVEENGKNSPL